MSESDTYTWEDMCAFSQWVDGKSEPEYLRLNRASIQSFSTWTWLVTCQYNNRAYFADDGNVYNDGGTIDMTAPWPIYNCIFFDDNVIIFYLNTSTNRMELGRIPAPNWSPNYAWVLYDFFDESTSPFTAPLYNFFEYYSTAVNETNAIMHFAIWQYVYTVTADTIPLVKKSLNFEDQVVSITKQWSQYHIYTQTWRKYFWDGVSDAVDGYVDLGETIKYVKDTRNYDYIVAWSGPWIYSRMYMSQWQSFQLINTASFTLDGLQQKRRHAYGLTTPYGNDTIAIDQSNVYIANEDIRWIEAYGNRIQWLPYGTTIEEADDNYVDIWALRVTRLWNFVNRSYKNIDGNWFVRQLPYFRDNPDFYTYQTEWEYITKRYVMWTRKIRQFLTYVRYDTPENTAIDLYFSTDSSGNYELLKTISDDEKSIKISAPDNIKLGYEFQYKIVLRTTDTTVTPKLYSLEVQYEQADR